MLTGVEIPAQAPPVHAPDGGTRETISSIDVPPLPNAPFSATVNTEWTRYLDNGAMLVWKNRRLIARDGQGRVYQERRAFSTADGVETALRQTEIADPLTHTIAICQPGGRVCELRVYRNVAVPVLPPARLSPDGMGIVRESLGTQHADGLELIGTRETQTSIVGPNQRMTVVKEFWYSPRLGVNISTRRTDPRGGIQIFTVTDINPSDPDAALFALPTNAQIIDLRGVPPVRR
jgi:hypothetical protein